MAEPTVSPPTAPPAGEPEAPEAKPRLVAVDPTAPVSGRDAVPETATATPERRSRIVTWGLLALLVLAVAVASVQSQRLTAMGERNTALGEEVQALEVQLSAATLQIQTFEMQQNLVRSVAADIADRVSELQALVEQGPGPGPAVEGP